MRICFVTPQDPQFLQTLSFIILTAPVQGALSIDTMVWFPYGSSIRYTPRQFSTSDDSFTVLLSNSFTNSTPTTVTLTIQPVDQPPIALNSSLISLIVLQSAVVELNATDIDTAPQDLRFSLTSTPKFGYANISVSGQLQYLAVRDGVEILVWQVSDGQFFSSNQIQINIGWHRQFCSVLIVRVFHVAQNSTSPPTPGALPPAQVAAIVVGSLFVFAIAGAVLAYFLYVCLMAAQFERTVGVAKITLTLTHHFVLLVESRVRRRHHDGKPFI